MHLYHTYPCRIIRIRVAKWPGYHQTTMLLGDFMLNIVICPMHQASGMAAHRAGRIRLAVCGHGINRKIAALRQIGSYQCIYFILLQFLQATAPGKADKS